MSKDHVEVKWKRKTIKSYGDVWDAAVKIRTKKEAEAFIEANVRAGVPREIFLANLGYLGGYNSPKQAARVNKLFSTQHPVLGRSREPRAAFTIGKAIGSAVRRRGKEKS